MGNNIYQESVDEEEYFDFVGGTIYRDVSIEVFTVNDQRR
jgi:hypothetical protein